MEIVINISESIVEHIKDGSFGVRTMDKLRLIQAVKNGTPLPKGHGRLGDLDALEKELINGIRAGNMEDGYEQFDNINCLDDCVETVSYAETIIEAESVDE